MASPRAWATRGDSCWRRCSAAASSAARWAWTCSKASPRAWPHSGQSASSLRLAERAATCRARSTSSSAAGGQADQPRQPLGGVGRGGPGRLDRALVDLRGRGRKHDLGGVRRRGGRDGEDLELAFGVVDGGGHPLESGQLGGGGQEGVELGLLLRDHLVGGVQLGANAPAFDDEGLVFLAPAVQRLQRGGRGPAAVLGGVGGLLLGGGGDGRGLRPGFQVSGLDAQGVDVGQHAPQPGVVAGRPTGIPAGQVTGRIEGSDAKEAQDQAQPFGGGLAGEGGQLLLLGEDRGPEGAVVHPEDRFDVPLGVPHPLRHDQAVAAGLQAGSGVDPAERAPHQVEVAFVLELDLGDAVAAHPGRTDLLLGGPGFAPQGPEDGLEQGRLAGAVGPVDADQTRWQLEVESSSYTRKLRR